VTGTNGQPISVDALGRAGREYVLQRATALPGGWTNITSSATGLLSTNTNLVLTDPSPPISPQLFYRIQVTMP
jgi:ABC-type branched-subunit amino acid transport system ATPase component